jgi:hypothetical protein
VNLKAFFLEVWLAVQILTTTNMDSYLDILDDHIKTHDEINIDNMYLFYEHKLLNDDTILVKSIETFLKSNASKLSPNWEDAIAILDEIKSNKNK